MAFQLKWNSAHATHTEGYAARGVSLWRDWLPDKVREHLMGKQSWEKDTVDFSARELFGNNDELLKINRDQFALSPKGRLRRLTGVFPQNIKPFRIVGLNNGHMSINLGHPLARHPYGFFQRQPL